MIKLLCVGKVRDRHLAALIDDYAKRIGRYHRIEIIEVKDEAISSDEKAVMKDVFKACRKVEPDCEIEF